MGEGTRRVVIAVGSLDAGPRRSLRLLIDRLPRARFELHAAGSAADTEAFGVMPGDVPIHELDGAFSKAAARLGALAGRLNADSVICASHELSDALLRKRSTFPEETRVVIRAHASLASEGGSPLARRKRRRTYARADALVCGSDDVRKALTASLGLPQESLHRIFDPIDVAAVRTSGEGSRNPLAAKGLGPHVLAIGPLVPSQGYDRLVDSVPALVERFAGAKLWILGEDPTGRGAEQLRSRAARLGVEDALQLFGPPEHPATWLAHADLLAVASHDPEPPVALLESLACDCPVITLAPAPATAELLRVTGCANRAVKALDWQREWFRGGAEEAPADLSAFEPASALSAWTKVLAQSS